MKYTLVLSLGGHLFTMLTESLLVLTALIAAGILLVRRLAVSPRLPGKKAGKSRKNG